MSDNTEKKKSIFDRISVIKFETQNTFQYLFQKNEKYRKWIDQPLYLKVYESVPEHTASINFILSNLIVDGIEEIDYWNLQKIGLDYLVYGGLSLENQKLRGGSFKLNYLDMGKCRLNPDKTKMGYSDNWLDRNITIKWKNLIEDTSKDGIYYFKNNKSRYDYPTPYYYSALKSLDTMSLISTYHNENAKNGFTPNVLINFNNGAPDEENQELIEKKISEKFTGPEAIKFLLSFNDSKETKTTIEKLDNDNLDTKFETLQKFIQGQIVISHQITSGSLIGVKPESQGFSQTEYREAMNIFEEVVIATLRRELEYGLSKLLNRDVKLAKKTLPQLEQKQDVNNLPENNVNQ